MPILSPDAKTIYLPLEDPFYTHSALTKGIRRASEEVADLRPKSDELWSQISQNPVIISPQGIAGGANTAQNPYYIEMTRLEANIRGAQVALQGFGLSTTEGTLEGIIALPVQIGRTRRTVFHANSIITLHNTHCPPYNIEDPENYGTIPIPPKRHIAAALLLQWADNRDITQPPGAQQS